MKRKFNVIVASMLFIALAVTGCDGKSTKATAALYTNYIEAIMDCSYHGELERYTEVVDADSSEAEEVYNSTVEYYANELLYYNDVDSESISDELYDKYVALAGEIMAKTKYTVNEATKVNDEYQVKIEIYPVDINDITYDAVEQCIDEFNKMMDSMDTTKLTDEQWLEIEEGYGENVYNILKEAVPQMGYKDVVSKVVIIEVDKDGYYGISDDEWYDIDDYVVDMK
ncbi:MAG: hypothetical protein PUF12_01475 [Thermoflexaceae bacterium]|nr:hypothetical protein [Thermoflexaceae bacterium]